MISRNTNLYKLGLMVLTALTVGFLAVYLPGTLFVHTTLDIQVTGKYDRATLSCTGWKDNTCTGYTTITYYYVVTRDETFSANGSIYSQVHEGQNYRVRAHGWKHMRYISRILTGPGL
jgi:hypothetical protein